jgi:hypothetical protein
MGRILAIGVVGLLAAVGAAPASASARVTCHSGKTVFKRPGVRVIRVPRVYGNPSTAGSHYREFYVCAGASPRPRPFWGGPFTSQSVAQYKLVGHKLGFVAFAEGVSGGASISVGWVQLPRGPDKDTEIWAREEVEEEEDPGPKVPSEEVNYAIAEDGTVAVVGEALVDPAEPEGHGKPPPREWEVCVLSVKAHGLSAPKALFKTTSSTEAPVLASIAIDATTVSWQNRSGLAVSVPR